MIISMIVNAPHLRSAGSKQRKDDAVNEDRKQEAGIHGSRNEPEHSECKHDDEHQGSEDADIDEVARVEARGCGCGQSFSFYVLICAVFRRVAIRLR